MPRNNKEPPIIAGFIEGLLAPVFELLFCVVITALNAVSSTMGSPNLLGFVALLSIIDVVRNIGLGLSKSQFATGHLIGSIFGILLFFFLKTSTVKTIAVKNAALAVA